MGEDEIVTNKTMKEILLIALLFSPLMWSIKQWFDRRDNPFFSNDNVDVSGAMVYFLALACIAYHVIR